MAKPTRSATADNFIVVVTGVKLLPKEKEALEERIRSAVMSEIAKIDRSIGVRSDKLSNLPREMISYLPEKNAGATAGIWIRPDEPA